MSDLKPCPLDKETHCMRVKCCVGCPVFNELVATMEEVLIEVDALKLLVYQAS